MLLILLDCSCRHTPPRNMRCDHFRNSHGFRNLLAIHTSDSKDLSGFFAAYSRNLDRYLSTRYFDTEGIGFRFGLQISMV